jgi:hypothetical protein
MVRQLCFLNLLLIWLLSGARSIKLSFVKSNPGSQPKTPLWSVLTKATGTGYWMQTCSKVWKMFVK